MIDAKEKEEYEPLCI